MTKEKILRYWPAIFFIGGFLFDILTTDRIDQSFGLIMQLLYLIVASIIIYLNLVAPPWWQDTPTARGFLKRYSDEIAHFCFGSLFSVYTIFYFKSASLLNSFIFLMVLLALLLANELPKLQKLGSSVKVALLSVCWSSYFVYVIPILTGSIGMLSFLVALMISSSLVFYLLVRAQRKTNLIDYDFQKNGFFPALGVSIVFCLLYFFKVLPPVPLSLKSIGIFHSVSKQGTDYNLQYEKANWWRFWESSAETFLARPGDRVNVFVQVFSPTDFTEKLSIDWYRENKKGWRKRDSIPLPISGGRNDGYRGHAYKKNYEPGPWQVRITTSDDRELGRISFNVVEAESIEAREWILIKK